LGKLDSAILAADSDGLMRAAHNLKGAASNFSIENMRKIAFDLELKGQTNDFDGVPDLMGRLRDEVPKIESSFVQLNEKITLA